MVLVGLAWVAAVGIGEAWDGTGWDGIKWSGKREVAPQGALW